MVWGYSKLPHDDDDGENMPKNRPPKDKWRLSKKAVS